MDAGKIVSEYAEEVARDGRFDETGGTLGKWDREDAAIRSTEPPDDLYGYRDEMMAMRGL